VVEFPPHPTGVHDKRQGQKEPSDELRLPDVEVDRETDSENGGDKQQGMKPPATEERNRVFPSEAGVRFRKGIENLFDFPIQAGATPMTYDLKRHSNPQYDHPGD
jgi:hypothetical protein